jgi:hypothetical protein
MPLDKKPAYIISSLASQITEKSGASTTARYTSNAIWESWGGGGYWPGAFSYLSNQGNYLYFNDKLNNAVLEQNTQLEKA